MHFNNPNPDRPETVDTAARRLYPGLTFDTALPQQWVDKLCARDLDPRDHFVWLYEQGRLAGRAAPVTPRGIEIAAICATYVR